MWALDLGKFLYFADLCSVLNWPTYLLAYLFCLPFTQVAHPVILKFGPEDYRMWAYGNEYGFGVEGSNLGRIGYFTSKDGINWKSFEGPGTKGSVLDPQLGTSEWDGGSVGVADVLFLMEPSS